MSVEKNAIKSNIIRGFGTLIAREFFLKLLSFFGQIILARILAPSDFGIYVIIVFIVNLFGLFSDIGLSLAIIQKKSKPTHQELSGVFWLKILMSGGLILCIWIFAPLVKVFYPSFVETNITMLRVFSLTLLLTSCRAIPIALLERKIKYNLISLIDIIGVFVYYAVGLLGAFLNFGVWSLILGAITKEVTETIILYLIQPFIPDISLKNNMKKMIKFGIYVQGNSVVMFFISSITPVLGGRLSGSYAVGLIDLANSIASIPNVIAMNFSRVAFAGYSKIQEEKEILSRSINKSIAMLSIILYFFPVMLLSFGGELVQFIYTDKWLDSVPSLYWFSGLIFFHPILASLGQAILSIGKSKEIFWATFIIAILGWIGGYMFIRLFGFTGVAMVTFFIYCALSLSYIFIMNKTDIDFSIILIAPKLIAAILAIIFSFALNLLLPSNFAVLVIKVALSVAVYSVLMFIFAKNDTLEIFGLIKNLIRSKKYENSHISRA